MRLKKVPRPHINIRFMELDDKEMVIVLDIPDYNKILNTISDLRDNIKVYKQKLKKVKK